MDEGGSASQKVQTRLFFLTSSLKNRVFYKRLNDNIL